MENSPEFKLIVSARRRTLALHVNDHSEIIVRAPTNAPHQTIIDFVKAQAAWIQKQLNRIAGLPTPRSEQYRDGDELLYLGVLYRLTIVPDQHQTLHFKNGFFLSSVQEYRAKEVLQSWFRHEAERLLGVRVRVFARRQNISVRTIRITNARTRWGSCSHDGRLNFSWRIIMAPLSVIDYVVAHELAHLSVHNHSARFWRRVLELCPQYREAHRWLKEHGTRLTL